MHIGKKNDHRNNFEREREYANIVKGKEACT